VSVWIGILDVEYIILAKKAMLYIYDVPQNGKCENSKVDYLKFNLWRYEKR